MRNKKLCIKRLTKQNSDQKKNKQQLSTTHYTETKDLVTRSLIIPGRTQVLQKSLAVSAPLATPVL